MLVLPRFLISCFSFLSFCFAPCVSERGRSVGTLYRNPIHCLYLTAKAEGVLGWYKGTTAHLLRIAPHTVSRARFNTNPTECQGLLETQDLCADTDACVTIWTIPILVFFPTQVLTLVVNEGKFHINFQTCEIIRNPKY